MELEEFEKILTKARDGDFSVRVDEYKVPSDYRSLAKLLNSTLEKAEFNDMLRRRADLMIKHNPMAIAILKKDKSRIAINKMYEVMWEGSHDELMRKKLYDFDINGKKTISLPKDKKIKIFDYVITYKGHDITATSIAPTKAGDTLDKIDANFFVD